MESMNAQNQGKCDVCSKLVQLLKGEPGTTVKLGLWREIALSAKCKIHPGLLKSVFSHPQSNKFENIEAYNRGYGAQIIFGTDLADSDTRSGYLGLFSSTLCILDEGPEQANANKARLVDPEWIDCDRLRHWKERCNREHGDKCTSKVRKAALSSVRPMWLVDCQRWCLVPYPRNASYVALSYVWGGTSTFTTSKSNIYRMLEELALKDPEVLPLIPRTIQDTINLVQTLGERYLWVDSLCIIQDDDKQKLDEINNMAAIYANASLTIVAPGDNASYGIRGLRGISSDPRDFNQDVFILEEEMTTVKLRKGQMPPPKNLWYTRAWTYQENLFSHRFLDFQNDTVQWKCGISEWSEELIEKLQQGGETREPGKYMINSLMPDIGELGHMISRYNERELTFPEDAQRAFAGITSSLSFRGGFLYGIPVLFFDIGLLWQPIDTLSERKPVGRDANPLPTWSWMAWKGQILPHSWYVGNSHLKFVPESEYLGPSASDRVVPLVKWFNQKEKNSAPTEICSEWYDYRQKYLDDATGALPDGWERQEFTEKGSALYGHYPETKKAPKCFYTNPSYPEHEFWYPVPLNKLEDVAPKTDFGRYISCRTRRASLYGGERGFRDKPIVWLRNAKDIWVGALNLHQDPPRKIEKDWKHHDLIGQRFELAEISRGYVNEDPSNRSDCGAVDELVHDERPKRGLKYEYYHVLWVESIDGVSYRRGLGRVEKESWESLELEWFDLTLG